MPDPVPGSNQPQASRRDFLTGKSLLNQVAAAGEALADELLASEAPQSRFHSGPTVRLGQRSMACEFDVILDPGPGGRLKIASEMLHLIDLLEAQMTVYRSESELSQLNLNACRSSIPVEPRLFDLLKRAKEISLATGRAFDPSSGPLVTLWNRCRDELRLPTPDEIHSTLEQVSIHHLQFNDLDTTLRYTHPSVTLNLGAIGKGYALDRGAEILLAGGLHDWLIHGGQSSILARGCHRDLAGWPVGIRNPQMPERLLATVLLKDRGMGTSGSGTRFFRLGGTRYGHIIDPRTGWPAEGMLSVTVMAPDAASADALATAFFVLGVEKSLEYCHNRPELQAILVPLPEPGRLLQPIVVRIPEQDLEFAPEATPRFHAWN